eukprot:PhF_6_TR43563/c0_g1_i1/m.66897
MPSSNCIVGLLLVGYLVFIWIFCTLTIPVGSSVTTPKLAVPSYSSIMNTSFRTAKPMLQTSSSQDILRPMSKVPPILFAILGTRKRLRNFETIFETWLANKRPGVDYIARVYVEPPCTPKTQSPSTLYSYVCTTQNFSQTSMGMKVKEVVQDVILNSPAVNWYMIIDDDTYVMLKALQDEVLSKYKTPQQQQVYMGYTTNIRTYRDPCLDIPLEQRRAFTPVVGGPGILLSYGALRALRSFMTSKSNQKQMNDYSTFGYGDLSLGFLANCAGMRGAQHFGFLNGVPPSFDIFGHKKNQTTQEHNKSGDVALFSHASKERWFC